MTATWRLNVFRHDFFSEFPSNLVYIYVFGVWESIGIVRFHVRPKIILVLSILINSYYFQLNALKPGILVYSFFGSARLFSCVIQNRGYGGHLDFIINLRLLA